MKKITVFVFIFFTIISVKAQESNPWAEYMTPSAVHTLLTEYTGSFKMEITMYMDKGKEPVVVTVGSENKMILGNRFLEMNQKGDMMGMPYESIMTLGFNNIDKKLALTCITNMGTGTLALFGVWDNKNNSANLKGTLVNPVTRSVINVRQKISFVDKDTLLIENFDQEGKKPESKTMQYKFSRITG